jgi:hypothetical protein
MAYDLNDAGLLDTLCEDLLFGDFPRAQTRALINRLFNGSPPYTDEQCNEPGGARINLSDQSGPRLAHEARSQFLNGFMTPARYFNATTDMGAKHKRSIYSAIVAKEANRPLKDSIRYFEARRGVFASLVLHGIAPSVWESKHCVIPRMIGVEDVLLPSNTLLGFDNLPFLVLRRSFTGLELTRATMRAKRDKGWNMPLVKRCLEWMDKEMLSLTGETNRDMWAPEKLEERIKENGFAYACDECPTLDCFDIYAYVEATEKQPSGWVRRIILDGYDNPPAGSSKFSGQKKTMTDGQGRKLTEPGPDDFLFTSGDTPVADGWQNIVNFQFADLSSVSPFRYHSVRSLGWMMYGSCHLQNRLKCKIWEATFESLLQYFKVKSLEDAQRAMKVELVNQGFIDDTIQPVPASERYQAPWNGIEFALQTSQQTIDQNSKSWTQSVNQGPKGSTEKTKFQVMAEVQAMNALVSAGLAQAYEYQKFEHREEFRRLMLNDSTDPIARTFRVNCLRQGVPEKILVPEAWEIQTERMMGNGNQTLEMMIAQGLMEVRQTLDPQPQREVSRIFVQALTHQPYLVDLLVPEKPVISDSIHDAETTFATLMMGIPVTPKSGLNAVEVAGVTIKMMQAKVAQIMKSGGVGTPQDVLGLQTAARYAATYIKQLSQDKSEQKAAKGLSDELGKVMNQVKAMVQRQQEIAKKMQQQNQQGNGGGIDPKTMVALKGKAMMDQQKLKTKQAADAQKLQQKAVAFRQGLVHDHVQHLADLQARDLEAASNIRRGSMNSMNEGGEE